MTKEKEKLAALKERAVYLEEQYELLEGEDVERYILSSAWQQYLAAQRKVDKAEADLSTK